MKSLVLALALLGACKFDPLPSLSGDDAGGGGDDGGGGGDGCVGLQCQVAQCAAGEETRVSGTVFLPNGVTPMPNIDVYVPATDPGPVPVGPSCTQCAALPGNPITKIRTDAAGRFVLRNIPSGDNIPLVITVGKWRRQLRLDHVADCTDTTLPPAETRLPSGRADMMAFTSAVNLPKIALTTGQADALECILRKVGLQDSEFGTVDNAAIPTGPEAVHLYGSTGTGGGVHQFTAAQQFAQPPVLWSNASTLLKYDVVMLACEGATNPSTKPAAARDAMKAYVDAGGRLFASHYHNIWIGGDPAIPGSGPPAWDALADFNATSGTLSASEILVDTANPGAATFSAWLLNIGASTANGRIPLLQSTARNSVDRVDPTMTTRWAYAQPAAAMLTQYFTFTTPVERPDMQRCGRVGFSDLHTSMPGGSPNNSFPQECSGGPLTPQELALVYFLFDLQSCVGTPL